MKKLIIALITLTMYVGVTSAQQYKIVGDNIVSVRSGRTKGDSINTGLKHQGAIVWLSTNKGRSYAWIYSSKGKFYKKYLGMSMDTVLCRKFKVTYIPPKKRK